MSNKRKRCKWCKEWFDADGMVKVPAGTFCSIDHALEFVRKKDTVKRKRQHTADKKDFYSNDRAKQLKIAQKEFNAFIRYRDKDDPCISCGRHHTGQYHAGHYRSVGAAPQLRFNQFNNNKQCAPCNNHKSGNAIEYRINLVKKIGLDKVEWIEAQNEPLKLSVEDIISIKVYYVQLLKRMKAS